MNLSTLTCYKLLPRFFLQISFSIGSPVIFQTEYVKIADQLNVELLTPPICGVMMLRPNFQ